MDLLAYLAFGVAFALLYGLFRLGRSKRDLLQELHSRDALIRKLQKQLSTIESQSLESKAAFSTISDVAFDPVLLLDDALNIITYNQSAERFFTNRQAVGQRLPAALESPDLLNLVELTLRQDETLEEQFIIGDVYYRARTQVMPYADGRRFVGIALQDISELVNLSRARRDLVANISHELRTPITRIRLIIEGLFLEAEKPKRKASIQSLKEIAMETDALLWLAQELLDLSMIESGQAIMRLVRTPLKQLVDEAMERLASQAAMKDLKIVSHVPEKLEVLCDADQLKRVLGNLIHNAIKWSPKNEAIMITATEGADEIVVSVLDNGPGVPDELCQRIFERFYQADRSRSGDEGTGLGLAICKHIVEAHGGRVWAEGNRRGNGGQFLFTLLKADADSPAENIISQSEDSLEAVSSVLI